MHVVCMYILVNVCTNTCRSAVELFLSELYITDMLAPEIRKGVGPPRGVRCLAVHARTVPLVHW